MPGVNRRMPSGSLMMPSHDQSCVRSAKDIKLTSNIYCDSLLDDEKTQLLT